MQQSVVLRHDVRAGEFHFDWMIDQPEILDEHRLRCWRCDIRPDYQECTSFLCMELPSHRSVYLTFEGQISGNRGSVVQLASGVVLQSELGQDEVKILIDWGDRRIQYCGQRDGHQPDHWRFDMQELTEEDQE